MQDNLNSKIMLLCFAALGGLSALVVHIVFVALSVNVGAVARVYNNVWFQQGVPVAAGFVTFIALFAIPKCRVIADEAISEVRKVVWPNRKDVIAMASVCCVMVIIVGVALGGFDFITTHTVRFVISKNPFH